MQIRAPSAGNYIKEDQSKKDIADERTQELLQKKTTKNVMIFDLLKEPVHEGK